MDFFKNNCVGQNPLYNLATQISSFPNPIELASHLQELSEEPNPQTYQMKDLFNEISNVDIKIENKEKKWKDNAVDEWLTEYSLYQDNNFFFNDLEHNYKCDLTFDEKNVFNQEFYFSNSQETTLQDGGLWELPDDLRLAGNFFLENVTDPLFEDSKFFGFLHEISKDIDYSENNNKFKLCTSNSNELTVANKWADEFCLKTIHNDIKEINFNEGFKRNHFKDIQSNHVLHDNSFMRDEFAQPNNKYPRMAYEIDKFIKNNDIDIKSEFTIKDTNDSVVKDVEAVEDTFWDGLVTHWKEVANKDTSEKCDWYSNIEEMSITNSYKDYIFVSNNEYSLEDLLDKGISYFNEGNFIEAVLHLESYLKTEPNCSMAWLLVGEAQAALENDKQAIAALNRCLNIEPKNLYGHLLLAVSYMNESLYSNSCQMLYYYLLLNSKYLSVLNESNPFTTNLQFSFVSRSKLQFLIDSYKRAIQINCENEIDANLQIALGILFNMADDYYKSADCFKTAIEINPKDWSSWNKLGAVLTLLNKDEEAITCYSCVLKLVNGCLRARHNIALSCVKLHSLEEAMQHFLSVLTIQEQLYFNKTRVVHQHNQNIWNLIKSTLTILNRQDLINKCDSRDLDYLKNLFLTN